MDMDYAAFRDGQCVAIADAEFGEHYAEDWRARGYDVRLISRLYSSST
jgi:hypothetical protein